MPHPRSNPFALDHDVEDDATVIDFEPHWSIQRRSLASVPLPVPVQVSAAPRAPLPPPQRPPSAFYSYAEEAASHHLDTERVAPLPMSDLESSWSAWLVTAWQRFAAPACGMIAGLIFVVGYLAYSSQAAPVATAAAPVPELIMPVEVAAVESTVVAETVVAESVVAETVVAASPSPTPVKRIAPKKRVSSTASRSKRRPIRFDTSTPLGNLRPSRSF